MAIDVVTLALAKSYTSKVGSTIQGTSYDYDTGKITFNTQDGDWSVKINNGMNATYKQTLDNVVFDATDETLKVNGEEVLTKKDEASGDIDFGGFFD